MNSVKHFDFSGDLTIKFIENLQKSFPSLESMRLSSSSSHGKDYLSELTIIRQMKLELPRMKRLILDRTSRNQISFLRLCTNLEEFILDRSIFEDYLNEIRPIDLTFLSSLKLYRFERNLFSNLFEQFPNLRSLILNTLSSDDEPPLRSFLHHSCHHKHRPVSINDLLEEYFKSTKRKLKYFRLGCFFERDQPEILSILSRLIRKFLPETFQFFIQSEPFHSTKCGFIQIHFI